MRRLERRDFLPDWCGADHRTGNRQLARGLGRVLPKLVHVQPQRGRRVFRQALDDVRERRAVTAKLELVAKRTGIGLPVKQPAGAHEHAESRLVQQPLVLSRYCRRQCRTWCAPKIIRHRAEAERCFVRVFTSLLARRAVDSSMVISQDASRRIDVPEQEILIFGLIFGLKK